MQRNYAILISIQSIVYNLRVAIEKNQRVKRSIKKQRRKQFTFFRSHYRTRQFRSSAGLEPMPANPKIVFDRAAHWKIED